MSYGYVYDPPDSRPGGGPQPGAKALLSFIVDEYDEADFVDDSQSLGIYNPRDVCGNQWPDWRCAPSAHATGRAGDASFPVERPRGNAKGWVVARILVAQAEVLGVQEVIWAGQRWASNSRQWARYSGRSDHFDHVHFALCKKAAAELTIDTIRAAFGAQEDPLMGLADDILAKVGRIETAIFPEDDISSNGEIVKRLRAIDIRTANPDALVAAVIAGLPEDKDGNLTIADVKKAVKEAGREGTG